MASDDQNFFQQIYAVVRRLKGAITVDPELNVTLSVVKTPFTSSSGNFSVTHNLGYNPSFAVIQITTSGASPVLVVWQDPLWDGTKFYLHCANSGVAGYIYSVR